VVPSATLGKQRAGGDPGMDPMRGSYATDEQPRRSEPQPWQRRQHTGLRIKLGQVGQHRWAIAALMRDDVIDVHTAAQDRGEHAPCARTDDQFDLMQRPPDALLHRSQCTRHPCRAEDSAGAEHETDPAVSPLTMRHRHDALRSLPRRDTTSLPVMPVRLPTGCQEKLRRSRTDLSSPCGPANGHVQYGQLSSVPFAVGAEAWCSTCRTGSARGRLPWSV
jgi:hypothetical protein